MHDAKGRGLKVGDMVMMPFTVTALGGGETHCNVSLESVATMPNSPGDGPEHKTTLSAVNTKQVLRATNGDELSFAIVKVGDQCVRIA